MEQIDWRLQGQEKYLKGKKIVLKRYYKVSEKDDHEHCEFCWKKISENSNDLHYGYKTIDGNFWICEQCFNDFLSKFNWKVLENNVIDR